MSLMRLAYASEATFEAKPVEKGVEPHVARILMTSRKNNAKDQLVGGLYYGNNRFSSTWKVMRMRYGGPTNAF